MILRDHEGAIIFSSCRYLFTCTDILEAELLAISERVKLALQWSNLHLEIESDCLEVVTMINGGKGNKSKYDFIIRQIISSMSERDFCITHIHQNSNSASHFMANFGRSQCRTAVWLGSGPNEVLDVVGRDCIS
ncbi:hypothetical protein ZWY2020_041385 [Hordeum vulgare]|nr:hypothetical protein ZWY2020_041385 [Hordeum vulgare]